MKPDIHPKYGEVQITCLACSTKFTVGSTRAGEMKTEVCSNCHPFFTGKQILLDTADRKSTRLNSSHSQQSRMPSSA